MAHILIVDDDKDSRDVLAIMLLSAGHTSQRSEDALEAIRHLQNNRFDVAIIDIFMPVIDGLELIQQFRRDYPAMKLIAISAGWSMASDVLADAVNLGADLAIPKPVLPEVVVAAVKRVLGARRET